MSEFETDSASMQDRDTEERVSDELVSDLFPGLPDDIEVFARPIPGRADADPRVWATYLLRPAREDAPPVQVRVTAKTMVADVYPEYMFEVVPEVVLPTADGSEPALVEPGESLFLPDEASYDSPVDVFDEVAGRAVTVAESVFHPATDITLMSP